MRIYPGHAAGVTADIQMACSHKDSAQSEKTMLHYTSAKWQAVKSRPAINIKQWLSYTVLTIAMYTSHMVTAQELFPPPEVQPQIHALKTTEKIEIDGLLDEDVWRRATPITEFVQKGPDQGEPATYRTEAKIAFDDQALYISAINYQPRSEIRVQNLERDFDFNENDLFGIAIDGFLDQRNAVGFQVTPHGNQRDLEVIDGTNFNTNRDARWSSATQIEDDYWTAEFAIPWRILRYPGGARELGIVLARTLRIRKEIASFPAVPRALTVYRMAYAAEMPNLETPKPSNNLQITPYILGNFQNSNVESSSSEFEVGGEVKWAITPNTVLDVTVNTDFAQAEVDRQAVNLNRFNVFFPERRQFFLENANIFSAHVTNWIRPFFSRRIGLDDSGNPIPIDGGVRLTSRTPEHEWGVLAMRQQTLDNSPASNFGVARYSRNIAGQSRVGGMLTWREDDSLTRGEFGLPGNQNLTYTVDGLWRPKQEYGVQAMVSVSQDDQTGDGIGAQFWAFYENNWLYLGLLEYYNKDYNPGIGLERLDTNYVMHSPGMSMDFRWDWLPDSIRSYNPGVDAYIFRSSDDGDLLFGYMPIRPLRLHFQNGARISAFVEPNWQRLEEPFSPVGIEIAPGRYNYTRYSVDASSDQSARLGGSVDVEFGDYFDGKLTTYSASLRYAPIPQVELTAEYELNQLRGLGVESRDKDTKLYSLGARLALNSRLQLSTFYQRNTVSRASSLFARLSWEYQPQSFFYLVYNRDELDFRQPQSKVTGNQIIAKLTYLFAL